MRMYPCPVCKKPLTKQEYDAALQLTKEQQNRHHDELEEAKRQARDAERRRNAPLAKKLRIASQRIKQLERGQTPQDAGIKDQHKLAEKLKGAFEPEGDVVVETGKAGDVLHTVRHDKKVSGLIVYECKSGEYKKRIPGCDIRQTAAAKQSCRADFAVLVTTGTRRDFGGYMEVDGVLICGPLCVIYLAELLRLHLVEMAKANITKKKRAQVAQNLLGFITSPGFKNLIEDAVRASVKLEGMIDEEAEDHSRVWDKRRTLYQRIRWDASQIQSSITTLLQGKQPQPMLRPKRAHLQLIAPRTRATRARA